MKAKELRQRAWNALKGRYWWTVLAALLAWLFGAVSMGATSEAANKGSDAMNGTAEATTKIEAYLHTLPNGAVITIMFLVLTVLLIAIAMSIISSSIRLGYCRFNMDLFTDVGKPTMHLLFSRLNIIWKALWMDILMGLLIGVGCLLFIVPGIILGLAYSQADYILAENPDLKAVDAMKKSRMMMKGNKWSLFCLGLSFIGWIILAAFIPAGVLLLTPYMEAADAAFYLDRTGRLADGAKDLGELEAKA
jgi:Predicted integral membrane protein